MKRLIQFIIVMCLLPVAIIQTPSQTPSPKWIPFTYTAYGTPTTIALADINMDGSNEVIFTDSAGYLYVLYKDGSLRARISLGSASYCPVVIADVDNDGEQEILTGNENGYVRVYNGLTYNLVWYRDYGSRIRKIAVADINNDHIKDVVFYFDKSLYVVYGINGSVEWSYTTPDYVNSFAIGDYVKIGGLEIAMADRDNNVYIFLANGSLWTKITLPSDPEKIISADLNHDGYEDIIFGADDARIYAFTGNGSKLWDVNMTAYVKETPAVADLNGDGVLEVIAMDNNHLISVVEENGSPVFSRQIACHSYKGISVFDVDGDGQLEIVAVSGEEIYIITFANEIKSIIPSGGGTISTPVSAGILRNPTISLVYSTGKYIREMFADGKRMFWYGAYGGGFDGCMRIHDADRDGVSDLSEHLLSLDENSNDTDDDSLGDGLELYIGTNPSSNDTDGDGLTDGDEYYQYGTDPLACDTDGDGYNDSEELSNNTDPRDPNSHPELQQESTNTPPDEFVIFGVLAFSIVLVVFFVTSRRKTEETVRI